MKPYLALFALLAGGCTVTKVNPETRQFTRYSLFQKVEFSEVSYRADGSVTLKGYRNDGGVTAAERITAAAVKAAVAGVAP